MKRDPWQGMFSIARFNWPFYAAAMAVAVGAIVGVAAAPWLAVKVLCALMLAGALYFLIGSLGVSHLIYDRSDLYRFGWLAGISVGGDRVICHSGFDEVSASLADACPGGRWVVLDHYDATKMTEPSIRRARALYPPREGTIASSHDRWPLEDASCDTVFGLLAIHELRTVAERAAWFAEARRCLRPGGRVVLAEHLRDLPNFVAFGPGFLHFHSGPAWARSWRLVGFEVERKFRVTPWISIFILR